MRVIQDSFSAASEERERDARFGLLGWGGFRRVVMVVEVGTGEESVERRRVLEVGRERREGVLGMEVVG